MPARTDSMAADDFAAAALDDPDILRYLVERALPRVPETEMTGQEYDGAEPAWRAHAASQTTIASYPPPVASRGDGPMPYADVGDMTMYYEEHGKADGPALVLLHGYPSNGRGTWATQLEAFGARYRLVVPDCRGRGSTVNPAGLAAMNHRQFARDTAALCRALGLERAAFCGQSSGAKQLLTLALEAPDLVRALVLSACSYYWSEELRASWRARTPETFDPLETFPELPERHAAQGPEHWRWVVASFNALADHAHPEDFPEPDELRHIRAPTLIVHGDRDHLYPAEIALELYRLLPDAELCVLPRTGHPIQDERPDWFNDIVLDFLARRAE